MRFGARDYDPSMGRWTARDPIGFAGGDSNEYVYVENNPINFVDSYGLRLYRSDFIGPLQPADSYYFVANMNDPRVKQMHEGGIAPEWIYPKNKREDLQKECVSLTQALTGAPCSQCWRAGPAVENNGTIPQGAAIAAGWTDDGSYPAKHGNSGIYDGQDLQKIVIIDQFPQDIYGNPHKGRARPLPFGNSNSINDGSAYRLITVPAGCRCSD